MERVRLARDTSQPLGLLGTNKELVRVLREVTLTKKETHRQTEREREEQSSIATSPSSGIAPKSVTYRFCSAD